MAERQKPLWTKFILQLDIIIRRCLEDDFDPGTSQVVNGPEAKMTKMRISITWACAELVLIGPEAVSSGDDVLLGDKDSAAVWENPTSFL